MSAPLFLFIGFSFPQTMCIYRFREMGLYVYASTEQILMADMMQLPFTLGPFYKMMQNPMSGEYELLQKTRQDFPTFTVRTRKIKTNPKKDTYKGLTYEWMRNYIENHEAEKAVEKELAAFDEMLLVSRCHRASLRYPTVKKWFLASGAVRAIPHTEREPHFIDKGIEGIGESGGCSFCCLSYSCLTSSSHLSASFWACFLAFAGVRSAEGYHVEHLKICLPLASRPRQALNLNDTIIFPFVFSWM